MATSFRGGHRTTLVKSIALKMSMDPITAEMLLDMKRTAETVMTQRAQVRLSNSKVDALFALQTPPLPRLHETLTQNIECSEACGV